MQNISVEINIEINQAYLKKFNIQNEKKKSKSLILIG